VPFYSLPADHNRGIHPVDHLHQFVAAAGRMHQGPEATTPVIGVSWLLSRHDPWPMIFLIFLSKSLSNI
jgi:hypothetical protein